MRKSESLELTGVTFDSEEHVLRIIDRIVAPLGRRVDESSPMVVGRLADGSRVAIIIRPIATYGPTLTITKFEETPWTEQDLIKNGTISAAALAFLAAAVKAGANIVVSGNTRSGKTTLLNVLADYISTSSRVVTIENVAELQLPHEHVVTLESRPANIEGKGQVTIGDLVINATRMAADYLVP